jgi:hypothetical protein
VGDSGGNLGLWLISGLELELLFGGSSKKFGYYILKDDNIVTL